MEGRRKMCKSRWSAKYTSPSLGTCGVRTLRRNTTQGLIVVGLIVEEFFERRRNLCRRHWSAKYRSRSPGQGTCQVSTSRRSLVARDLPLEIWNVDVNYVKVAAAKI